MALNPVTEPDLERCLERLAAEVEDPGAGLFGPASELWRVNRHAALFLGGGRAALLQLAHPAVAQAIVDHSSVQSDPFARFQRTFYHVFAMVYGDLESALTSARRVGRIHRSIHGHFTEGVGRYRPGALYDAADPQSLVWVHATLWETSILLYETIVRPLSLAQKNEYYQETRRFADLFGIERSLLPRDWPGFVTYNQQMWSSDRLAVGSAGIEVARSLFRPRLRMPWPVAGWYRTLTTGLLPPRLRQEFRLPFGGHQQRVFELSIALLRRSHRFWPRRIRFVPPYLEALRRLDGHTERDRLGECMTRLYLGRLSR